MAVISAVRALRTTSKIRQGRRLAKKLSADIQRHTRLVSKHAKEIDSILMQLVKTMKTPSPKWLKDTIGRDLRRQIEVWQDLNENERNLKRLTRNIQFAVRRLREIYPQAVLEQIGWQIVRGQEKINYGRQLVIGWRQQTITDAITQAGVQQAVANAISFKIDDQFQQTLSAYANHTSKSFAGALLHVQSQLGRHIAKLLPKDQGVVRVARTKADERVKFLAAKSTAIPRLRVADIVVLQKAAGKTDKWKHIAHGTDYRGPEQIRIRLKGKKRKIGGRMVAYTLFDKSNQLMAIASQTRGYANRIRWALAGGNARSCDLMVRSFGKRFLFAQQGKAYKSAKTFWSNKLSRNEYYKAGFGKKLTMAKGAASGSRWSPVVRRRLYGKSSHQVIPSLTRRAMRRSVSDMTRHIRGQETLWKAKKRHREKFLV